MKTYLNNFCFDIKISRQIDIRVCQKASWCINVSKHASYSIVFMYLYCFIGDEVMYGSICNFIYRFVFCQTIRNVNALIKFSIFLQPNASTDTAIGNWSTEHCGKKSELEKSFALLVHVDNLLGEMLPIRWPNDEMTVPYNDGESI